MHFYTKSKKKRNLFDLGDIDLGSPKLQEIEIFSQTTAHKNLVILAFIGAELAGGGADSAPLPVHVILDPIPGRGLNGYWFMTSVDVWHFMKCLLRTMQSL